MNMDVPIYLFTHAR